MNEAIGFAASAGMLAAFNPCGFALLPGYLVMFLGPQGTPDQTVRRALVVAAAVTVGFVAVFGGVGVAISALSLTLGPWLALVTFLSGLLLFLIGAFQLAGRDVVLHVPRARLRVDGSVPGMAAYGVVYASVSLSCTLPVFLAAVVTASATPGVAPTTSLLAAVAYAVGMGLVLATLTLVVGLLGHAALGRMRSLARFVGRGSGAVVLAAALYVLWYSWVELASYRGKQVSPGPVAWVGDLSASISQRMVDAGTWPTVLGLCGFLTAVVIATFVRRQRR